MLQSELTALYTGPDISGAYVYANLFTTLLAILTFSPGMPILYPIAALYYIVHYLVYHCLFLRYLKKTAQFNQTLPQASLNVFYIGVVLHLFFGTFMFTNQQLIPPVAAETLGSYAQSLFETYAADTEENLLFTYSIHSIIYTAVLLLFIAIPIVRELLGGLLIYIWRCLCSCCSDEEL